MINNKTIHGYQLKDYFKKLKDKLDTNSKDEFTITFGNNLSIPVKKIDAIDKNEGPEYEIKLYQEEDSLNPVRFNFVTGQAFRIMESNNSMRIWRLER